MAWKKKVSTYWHGEIFGFNTSTEQKAHHRLPKQVLKYHPTERRCL
jgi:hypothetical protein